MRSLWTLFSSLACLIAAVTAKSSTGDSVLVVLDPSFERSNFSAFFAGLEEQGYDLTFRAPKDAQPAVIENDHAQFSHVILFAPETKTYSQDITPQSLVSLLAKDTNLLIAVGPKQTLLTSLASEFSLILPPPGTPLISHFPERDAPATLIPVEVAASPVLSPDLPPVWFSGVPFALGSSPHIVPLLRAPPQSFAVDSESDSGADALFDAAEKGGEGLWAGSSLGLVAGFQTLTGSRATWVGSVELFSDEYFEKEVEPGVKSGNKQFASEVTAWTFKETNTLRIDSVAHHRVNETLPREMYTINDHVEFEAHISHFDPETSTWEPYSDIEDMQIEFTMLDPHIRTALKPVAGEPGKYGVAFRVPDRHGVFKFVIDHKRRGWSYLQSTTVVPVVPPRHDEYPRFLSPAWPYYAGAISTSIGFVAFSALWLAGDSQEAKKKSTKSE